MPEGGKVSRMAVLILLLAAALVAAPAASRAEEPQDREKKAEPADPLRFGPVKIGLDPNNDTALIGDISVIGDLGGITVGDVSASGLHVVTVGGGIDVMEKFNVSLDGHWFRADKVPAGVSKDIGIEADLILTYAVSEKVSVLASANRFFTGDFFKDAAGSGKDIHYVYAQLQATF